MLLKSPLPTLAGLASCWLVGCQLVDNTIGGRFVEAPPSAISDIADQELILGTALVGLEFTVTPLPRGAGNRSCSSAITLESNSPNVIGAAGISVSGHLPSCYLNSVIASGALGSSTITLRFSLRGASAEKSFLLSVLPQGSPLSPTGLTATATGTAAIQLAWTSGGGSTVDHRISYLMGSTPPTDCATGTVVDSGAIDGTSHLITGLLPGTAYSFRVCGINGNPSPDISAGTTVSATTLQEPPPDPSGLSAVPVMTGHVLLLWTSSGLSSENFRISYQAGVTAPSDCTSGQVVSEAQILPSYHLIGPLNPTTPYSFRVCAINANPTPDVSPGITVTTTTATPKLAAVEDLGIGWDSSCAIDTNGKLWCWGRGTEGQLGDGLGTSSATPIEVAPGSTWLSVAAGSRYACGIRASDSRILCWGEGTSGRRGDGTTSTALSPVLLNTSETFKWLDTSDNSACAIASDDRAWCWGAGGSGVLGNGGIATQLSPVLVVGGHTWKAISAGASHTCGIRLTDNSAWCWGRGTDGEMGNNTTTPTNTSPVPVSGGHQWKMISAGWDHTCAIRSDDSLWCWGRGAEGQLGENNNIDRLLPTPVTGGGAWKYVEAFYLMRATCGIKMDDTAWCWGGFNRGNLGNGAFENRYAPTPVFGGHIWKALDGTEGPVCAIRADDNSLYCWGDNIESQGSRGSARDVPLAFGVGYSWKKVGNTESRHSCAIRSDDTLWCWGSNLQGQLGDGLRGSRWEPGLVAGGATWSDVSQGGAHTCGIQTNGSLWCWGDGEWGQIGNGSTNDSLSPTAVAPGQTWKAVATSESASCAIRSDDTAWCWGQATSGQLGNGASSALPVVSPNQIANPLTWKQIVAGDAFFCGLRFSDDSIWCWGRGTDGQIGNGVAADIQPRINSWT